MAPKNVDGEEKVQWPSKHEEFFIHILHDHVKKGDLQASTFKTKVWSEISEELLAKCGKKCTVKQLKSKFNRLRIAHREFSDLIEHTGFGWDPNANTVTASEDVWASYIKSKPRAKQYRTQGLVHYQLLGEIFNTTTATGQLRYASNQLPPNSDEERELENNFLNTGVHIDVDLDDDGFNLETDHGKGKRKSVTATPPERRSKKWDKMESYLEVCSEVMSQRLQTIQKEKSVEASSTSKEMYSIEECIGIVEEMGDIDNDTFNKMLEKIVLIEWRKIFVTMSDARRRSWLASL
ncbi:PREDICTED: L10-interacting MYB domain-containing protein-like [Prunus mume]|uniref:L10-interacting MYB domain-containing protein-like n=1 Tax=Prunus mume TaxID=102107 RepID=A0ABM0PXE1_PRUMU|nr:PREDICTED: L10-interacting MYB domain-containing protein-like [Prunus mume]